MGRSPERVQTARPPSLVGESRGNFHRRGPRRAAEDLGSRLVLGVHVAVAVHVKVNDNVNVNDHGPCSLT
jgi:hypothetical protein